MTKPSWLALAVTLAVAGACSRTIEDKVVDARKAPCTTLCDRMAECPGELPTPAFATREECLRQCTESDGSFGDWWAYQADKGKDACAEPFEEKIACETALSCEERRDETAALISESQCGELSVAAWQCAQQHKDGAR